MKNLLSPYYFLCQCLLLLLMPLLSHAATLPSSANDNLKQLWHRVILPILQEGSREEGTYRMTLASEHCLKLTTRTGQYIHCLTDDQEEVYPKKGLPELRLSAQDNLVTGYVNFLTTSLHADHNSKVIKKMQDLVRSLYAADPELHPHLAQQGADGKKLRRLSDMQNAVMSDLQEKESRRSHKGLVTGLVMPTGSGKTLVSARYGKLLKQILGNENQRILFCVENTEILSGALRTFQQELNLKPEEIARFYGGQNSPLSNQTKLIGITRSTYYLQKDTIHRFLFDGDTPIYFIFDEAHHTGKEQGQFADIHQDLETRLRHNDTRLYLSATPWHNDPDMISRILQDNIVSAYRDRISIDYLESGNSAERHAAELFLENMVAGYAPAIRSIRVVQDTEHESRAYLGSRRSIDTTTLENTDSIDVYIPDDLIESVANKIVADRIPGIFDRTLILSPSTAHANAYARKLQEKINSIDTFTPAEFYSFHR